MKEKFKTFILIVLVAGSLYQSYMLAYGTPNFEAIHPAPYVPTTLKGTKLLVHNLIKPSEIILHMGQDQHTLLYPDSVFYNLIMKSLEQRSFDGVQRMPLFSSPPDMKQMRKDNQGVEMRFHGGVPLRSLKSIFNIRGDGVNDENLISRIWITEAMKQDSIQVIFFTKGSGTLYESSNPDITTKDVARYVGLGSFMTRYDPVADGQYYLPDAKQISFKQLKMSYHTFATDDLRRNLFVDPEMTKSLLERDGSEIYTDGKRGLQIQNGNSWMSFSDPAAPMEGRVSLKENLDSSVQFVNEHGGWNGQYLLDGFSEISGGVQNSIMFRQYVDQLPVYTQTHHFGIIQIDMHKNAVTKYNRSIILLDRSQTEKTVQLPAGSVLQKLLNREMPAANIEDVFPAYQADISNNEVEFIPTWAVEQTDHEVRLLGHE